MLLASQITDTVAPVQIAVVHDEKAHQIETAL